MYRAMNYLSQCRVEGKAKWGGYGQREVWKLSSQPAQLLARCDDLGKSGIFLSQNFMVQVKVYMNSEQSELIPALIIQKRGVCLELF